MLGWDIDAIQGLDVDQIATAFSEAYSGITDLVEDPPQELADVVRALIDIGRVIDGVRNFGEAVGNAGNVPQEFAAVGADLVEFLITDYLWRFHPRIYYTFVLLTLIKDPADIDP